MCVDIHKQILYSTESCGNCSPQANIIRDSRPDIIAWPTPPNVQSANSNSNHGHSSEESAKLFSILKVATSGTVFPFVRNKLKKYNFNFQEGFSRSITESLKYSQLLRWNLIGHQMASPNFGVQAIFIWVNFSNFLYAKQKVYFSRTSRKRKRAEEENTNPGRHSCRIWATEI